MLIPNSILLFSFLLHGLALKRAHQASDVLRKDEIWIQDWFYSYGEFHKKGQACSLPFGFPVVGKVILMLPP